VLRECKSTGAGTSEAYTARSAQAKKIKIIKIQTQIRPNRKEKGENELNFGRSLSAERERERERERGRAVVEEQRKMRRCSIRINVLDFVFREKGRNWVYRLYANLRRVIFS